MRSHLPVFKTYVCRTFRPYSTFLCQHLSVVLDTNLFKEWCRTIELLTYPTPVCMICCQTTGNPLVGHLFVRKKIDIKQLDNPVNVNKIRNYLKLSFEGGSKGYINF